MRSATGSPSTGTRRWPRSGHAATLRSGASARDGRRGRDGHAPRVAACSTPVIACAPWCCPAIRCDAPRAARRARFARATSAIRVARRLLRRTSTPSITWPRRSSSPTTRAVFAARQPRRHGARARDADRRGRAVTSSTSRPRRSPTPSARPTRSPSCKPSALVQARAGFAHTIVRPTLVYDEDGGPELRMFLDVSQRFPLVPFIGAGSARKRPVWPRTSSTACAPARNQPDQSGKTYNFSGGEAIRCVDFARLLLAHHGRGRRSVRAPARRVVSRARLRPRQCAWREPAAHARAPSPASSTTPISIRAERSATSATGRSACATVSALLFHRALCVERAGSGRRALRTESQAP